MKKKFIQQPKFIIPLILLPFIIGTYYFFFRDEAPSTTTAKAQTTLLPTETKASSEGINTSLPAATDQKTSNRLEAYKSLLEKATSDSKLNGLEESFDLTDQESASKRQTDSINKRLQEQTTKALALAEIKDKQRKAIEQASQTRAALLSLKQPKKNPSPARASRTKPKPTTTKTKDEMATFKKQMRYLDSLQNPQRYQTPTVAKVAKKDSAYSISRNPHTSSSNDSFFNTVKADLNKTLISAILDEGIKAWEGSRVRIRLLEPIFINGRLLAKGQYLYGICQGFSAQRLKITVSSVVIQDEILPIDITLYDNDGIEGIYIPASSFRTFTKELGSSAISGNPNLNDQSGARNNTQLLYQSISRSVQSSTRAIQKALRKNKARLKYNTKVYLVNSKNN